MSHYLIIEPVKEADSEGEIVERIVSANTLTEFQSLAIELYDSIYEERTRLATALHDGPMQELGAAMFALESNPDGLCSKDTVLKLFQQAIESLQNLEAWLHNTGFMELGLASGLDAFANSLPGEPIDLQIFQGPHMDALKPKDIYLFFNFACHQARRCSQRGAEGRITLAYHWGYLSIRAPNLARTDGSPPTFNELTAQNMTKFLVLMGARITVRPESITLTFKLRPRFLEKASRECEKCRTHCPR